MGFGGVAGEGAGFKSGKKEVVSGGWDLGACPLNKDKVEGWGLEGWQGKRQGLRVAKGGGQWGVGPGGMSSQ